MGGAREKSIRACWCVCLCVSLSVYVSGVCALLRARVCVCGRLFYVVGYVADTYRCLYDTR